MTSTPAAAARRAASTVRTWQMTSAPASCAAPTYGVGSANECATTRTPSPSAAAINSAVRGRWLMKPTPNGRSVNSRASRICSTSHSAPPIVVPPMSPRPPASETAAASLAGTSPPPIGALRIGYSMPNTSQSRVCNVTSIPSSCVRAPEVQVSVLSRTQHCPGVGSSRGSNAEPLISSTSPFISSRFMPQTRSV